MCGIVGILLASHAAHPARLDAIEAMERTFCRAQIHPAALRIGTNRARRWGRGRNAPARSRARGGALRSALCQSDPGARRKSATKQEVVVPDVRILSLASPPERPSSTNPLLFRLPGLPHLRARRLLARSCARAARSRHAQRAGRIVSIDAEEPLCGGHREDQALCVARALAWSHPGGRHDC